MIKTAGCESIPLGLQKLDSPRFIIIVVLIVIIIVIVIIIKPGMVTAWWKRGIRYLFQSAAVPTSMTMHRYVHHHGW